jgi:hypothetical protein
LLKRSLIPSLNTCKRKPKGESRMGNPSRDTINIEQTTQNDIYKTGSTTQKTKNDEQHGPDQKQNRVNLVLVKGKQFLLLLRHPSCYS